MSRQSWKSGLAATAVALALAGCSGGDGGGVAIGGGGDATVPSPFPLARLSLDSAEVQGNAASAAEPNVASSWTGAFAVFSSSATNLVAGDTNAVDDIFLRDRVNGNTTRVSVDTAGAQADGPSDVANVNPDATLVTFRSAATNLVADDTNGVRDVFVRDLNASTTTRVSVATDGTQANGASSFPMFSDNGRFVVFSSAATNLVADDTNAVQDIFVRDRVLNTTARVNLANDGSQANGFSTFPIISGDGRFVAFSSDATNLVAGDTNGATDIFVRDLANATTTRVSVDSAGAQGNGASRISTISGDGSLVGFESVATDLVVGDTNGVSDAFVHSRLTGATVRVSVDSAGVQGNAASILPDVRNGRYVAFQSVATNLVVDDTNATSDVFVFDLVTARTVRVSVDADGVQGNGFSGSASLSPDGRQVVFNSDATNLVPDDTNAVTDVFEAPNPFIP